MDTGLILSLISQIQHAEDGHFYFYLSKAMAIADLLQEPHRTEELKKMKCLAVEEGYLGLAQEASQYLHEEVSLSELEKIYSVKRLPFLAKLEIALAFPEEHRLEKLESLINFSVTHGWLDEAVKIAALIPRAVTEGEFEIILKFCIDAGWGDRAKKTASHLKRDLLPSEIEALKSKTNRTDF